MLINALQAVAKEPATMTPTKLAQRLGLKDTAGLVRELTQRGWVEEVGGHLLLTDAGEGQVKKTSVHVPKFLQAKNEPPPLGPQSLRIWLLLRKTPDLRAGQIADALEMKGTNCRSNLSHMVKGGHLQRDDEGRYRVTRQSTQAELKRLAVDLQSITDRLNALLRR